MTIQKFNYLERSGCFIENFGELLQEIGTFADPNDEGTIKIPSDKLPALFGKIWLKIKESFNECEGKEVVIEFGDSPSANLAETVITFILNFLEKEAQREPNLANETDA